jgi:surface antigen
MPISSGDTISPYLMLPSRRFIWRRRWLILKSQLTASPNGRGSAFRRTAAALGIWAIVWSAFGYATTPHSLSGQKSYSAAPKRQTEVASAPSAGLTSATSLPTLSSGPSGLLLPPGTMAADGTFANNYARGQCTWYVAGRRQVPAGWGNAATWYYHAVSSGWRVGSVPAIAAIAWTPAGYYGHVALVEQISPDSQNVYISEMNYRAVGVKSYRWVPASSFKYIY